jgi:hypothetical protein
MGKVTTGLSMSLDGFIAGANEGPVLLGRGVRLFEYLGIETIQLDTTRVVAAPGVTHLQFRVRH